MKPNHGRLWTGNGRRIALRRMGCGAWAIALLLAGGCASPDKGNEPLQAFSSEVSQTLALAEQLSSLDPALSARLHSMGGWAQDGAALTSIGWRVQDPDDAPTLAVRLSEKASAPWELGLGQEEHVRFQLVPLGASESRAVLDNGRAIYRDVYPDTDAILGAAPSRIEQLLILRGPKAPRTLGWRLQRDTALTGIGQEPSGALVLKNGANEPVIRLLAPSVIDSQAQRHQLPWQLRGDELSVDLGEIAAGPSMVMDFVVEYVAWTQPSLTVRPPGRSYHAMASRGPNVVLFGGACVGGLCNTSTWEFNGIGWTQFAVPGPSARQKLALTSMPDGSALLFGGSTASGDSGETWRWDGAAWTQLHPEHSPSARYWTSMTTLGGHAVLFSGQSSAPYLLDTWDWNGTDWTQLSPPNHPPPTFDTAFASIDSSSFLLAGYSENNAMWRWDGTTWTNLNATFPRHWYGVAMARLGPRLLSLGGCTNDGCRDGSFEWIVPTSSWISTQVQGSGASPSGREGPAIASLGSNRAVAFGGNYSDETWIAQHTASQGSDCTTGADCTSGFCNDGVCCGTDCGSSPTDCQACNVPGHIGVCWNLPSTTVCRAATGDCDVAETCTGTSGTCPDNAFRPTSYVCRAAAGPCDAAETCDGHSSICPLDFYASVFTVCRAAAGPCDAPENCTGTSIDCPADRFSSSAVVCRAAEGACDVAESCSGTSAACPADAFRPSTYVCRAAAGPCDVAESCTGSLAVCPGDALRPSAFVCRASAGDCDMAESCDGTSIACPNDAKFGPSQVCRAASGDCDVAETCTGADNVCPVNAFANSATVCRTPSCSSGTATLAGYCSGASPSCPAVQTQTCAPYLCGPSACSTQCNNSDDCADGSNSYCNAAHQCVPKLNLGQACSLSGSCRSGFCVDGYCCDTSCSGQCEACDLPSSRGTCTPTQGAPHGNRPACASDGSSCSGRCDGTATNGCAYPGASVQCRAASCTGTTATAAASCNGTGSCPSAQTQSCGVNGCAGTQCLGDCVNDDQCGTGRFCLAGVCTAKYAQGHSCSGENQCESQQCVDGVCCDRACQGQCEACDVVGHVGACTPVQGAPHAPRAACQGASECAYCDGTSTEACALASSTKSCGTPRCQAEQLTSQACNGLGECVDSQPVSCGAYGCNVAGTGCLTTCTSASECAGGYECQGTACVAPQDAGPDVQQDAEMDSAAQADALSEDGQAGAAGTGGSGAAGAAGASGSAGQGEAGASGSAGSGDPGDSGCSVSAKPSRSGAAALMLVLGLGALGLSRRKR